MDFRYTEDQLSIQSIARDFAQKRIAPVAAEFDKSGEFPLDNIREMGQLGLMGIEVSHEYGGAMVGSRAVVRALREVGGHPRYTEYPNEQHVIWHRAYAERALLPWMLDQRVRGAPCSFAEPLR